MIMMKELVMVIQIVFKSYHFLSISYSDDLDSPDQKYLVINQNQAIKILLNVNHYHDTTRLHATLHHHCVITLHIQSII